MPGPLTRGSGGESRQGESPSAATAPVARLGDGLTDPGVVRNTLLQLVSQAAGAVFTAGLTLYLVRALGASGYGVYALAITIGTLVLYPAGLGLPWAIGRFLADYIDDLDQLRAIFLLGLRLQAGAAVVASIALFAASGAAADAFGNPHLGWPLRWVAVSVAGQGLFVYLASAVTSVRRIAVGLWMSVIEGAAETAGSATLVAAGAGAAGATVGKAIGYSVATVAGLYLTLRLLRRTGPRAAVKVRVGLRTIARYAGAMFVVDVAWSAIAQVDVVLIGAILSSAAVGSFSAVLRLLNVLGYLGVAVASGVAPRLSQGRGMPDTRAFSEGIRLLIVLQGLVIAPMVVWAGPIVGLLFGPGYQSSPEIMRILAVQAFVSGPAVLVSVAVTYLGEARRRVPIVLGTLALGLVATYLLIRALGVAGAAIGDDLVLVVYVAAHLWICARLMPLDLWRLARSLIRTLLAAAVMALALWAIGTGHLSAGQWIAGSVLGAVGYAAALLVTREVSVSELRTIAARLRARAQRPRASSETETQTP
jgi:O-antigen/teichoic acid export membrane protein